MFANVLLLISPDEITNPAFEYPTEPGRPAHPMRRGLDEINRWLRERMIVGKFEVAGGFGIFAGGLEFGDTDPDRLLIYLHTIPWKHPQDVQIMVKVTGESRYTLYALSVDYWQEVRDFLDTPEGQQPGVQRMLEEAFLLRGPVAAAPAEKPVRRMRVD